MNAIQSDMKRITILFLIFLSLLTSGCEDVDVMLAANAGMDAIKAATLSDEAVRDMAMQAALFSDSQNKIAANENKYHLRLKNLTDLYGKQDGYVFNFKVYLAPEINAFAMADGTIRIYSGLMDMMDNGELLFVIGHEMGHVVKKHVQKKIRVAYAGQAVRKGAASIHNEIGTIARSQLGGFAEKLLNAQFSQQEEREADDYGLVFLNNTGIESQAAISALRKLATLGNNHTFLSSHPAPEERADRLEYKLKQEENPQRVTENKNGIVDYILKHISKLQFAIKEIKHG